MTLKQSLYSCATSNDFIFQLINDYSVEGYFFWKKNQSNKLVLDATLASKLSLTHKEEYDLKVLGGQAQEFLETIINEVQQDVSEVNAEQQIKHLSTESSTGKTTLFYGECKIASSNNEYILVAIQSMPFLPLSRHNDLLELLDIAVWKWNLETNELIINERWANILGYTSDELQPLTIQSYEKLTHPEDSAYSLSLVKDYLAGKSNEYSCEVRMRHKAGYWKWVLGKGKIISRNNSGEPQWLVGSHIDITERKAREKEIDTLALVPLNTLYSVVITDEVGKIVFVNNSFENMTGYRLEEVIGKKPGRFLQGPLTKSKDILSFKNNILSGKPFTQEITNYTKQGQEYLVSCDVNPVYSIKGEIIKYIYIQTDVTEKKANQQFLATFKNTLDQTEDCIFIFDHDTLQFNYVNQGAINMMGYSEEELLLLHPFDIKPEYSESEFRLMLDPLIKREKVSHRFKTKHKPKEGADIPVEVFLQFIHNEHVKPHFVAIVKNISDEIETQKKLKRLSLVAEKTNNLVLITDDSGYIEYVNPAFEEKTGYSLNEVIGDKPGKFLHGKETNPIHVKANREGLKKLIPFTQEILNYSKAGDKYWVSITFNPVFNEKGVLTNFIAVESDISDKKFNEMLLKESAERLQFVLNGSELGYWDWEADSGKMTVNDRWYEMLGYNPEDFKPSIENWHALVHPEDMGKLNQIMKNIFPDPHKSEFSVELRAKHKRGHYLWILDRGAVVERDKFGAPNRISGMHMEISDRKKLEHDLELERQFLNKIINTDALNLMVLNKDGRIIFVNHGTEEVLGLSKSVIEQKTYNDPIWNFYTMDGQSFPSKDLPFKKVMETGVVTKDTQLSLIWNDGTVKFLSLVAAPMSYDNGTVNEVVITIIDITKRIEAEKQLDQTKNQMESILKDLSDVVWSVSLPSYKMQFVTPSIEKLTGYSPSYYLDKLVSDSWELGIFNADKYLLENAYANLNENGSFESEYRIKTKEGALKWVLVKGVIINDSGIPSRLDGYIADISERKKQENSLKKYVEIVEDQNDRLKNFTYIVSHNLRSHSANIQGLMYLINNKHPELAENEFIKMLNKASNKLDDTLHHLNNVVSVVSSTEEIKKVNLGDAVTAFLDTFENMISEAQVYFLNEVSQNVLIEAVPAFFESIVTNLLTNAIKYRDPEKSESYVRISNRSIKGIVIIEIEDNGLGIDLDKYGEKLFGMYKTFHNHKDSRGLGLFLTRNQVESMGGKIEVESIVGKGSTFKVFLKDGSI